MKSNEQLISAYRSNESEEILNQLIQQNMGFITNIVKRYVASIDSIEDATNDGIVGLIESIKNYDESKGKFTTYAYFHILSSIREGRKQGSDYTSELARTIKVNNPNMPLHLVLKQLKKSIPTVSKHFFLTAIQQDYNNNPEISLNKEGVNDIYIAIQDNTQWQTLYDIHQLTKNKPPIVRNIIILMSKGKSQKDICRTLNISRPTLIHKLKMYFPVLVSHLKDRSYEGE